MNALALPDAFDLAELFDPPPLETVADLLAEYRDRRARISQLAELFADADRLDDVRYFVEGNADDLRYSAGSFASRLFAEAGAVAALNAESWQRLLRLTDILEVMPAKRREEWHDQIQKRKTPDFAEDTVRQTLAAHLAMREHYFAERVDGIFRALSGEHVTNRPEGFSKRMILANVHCGWYANSYKVDVIHDLRTVVAKFMGRDVPDRQLTDRAINIGRQRRTGEWMTLDGGALKMRVYKKGTAHLEVHPELAWRLNCVLASLHPNAIPSQHRTRPKRKPAVELFVRPVPFAVLEVLRHFERQRSGERWHFSYGAHDVDKHVLADAKRVLQALGGAPETSQGWRFPYDVRDTLDEVLTLGVLPDEQSHQYYPTPPEIAERVAELAGMGPADTCLEPSAGQGHLARLLPKERTTCVEASKLHCVALRSQGFDVVEGDFLEVAPSDIGQVTRVVMNPPFSLRRWRAHVEHAATFVKPGGRLVAVLPASAQGKDILPGWRVTWHDRFDNAFAGCSASVVILVAERA